MSWLPGDSRGHWSAMFDVYGQLRSAGHQINLPDPNTEQHARRLAVDRPMTLKPAERVVAAFEISQHIRQPTNSPGLARGKRAASLRAQNRNDVYAVTPGKPGAMFGEAGDIALNKPVCYAAAVEDNHVHLLLGPVTEDISRCVGRIKGRTASILKQLPANHDRKRIWTGGFWKVFLFDGNALRAVAKYIEQHNIRRGTDGSPYDWLTPIEG